MNIPKYNISFYLRKYRINKENKAPIYIRISLNKEKMEIPSGQYIDITKWDDKAQRVIRCNDVNNVNNMLTIIKGEVNQVISQLYISGEIVTIANIRKMYKGESLKEIHTLITTAEEHNKHFEGNVGIKYSYGSYKNYKTTLKYLREFVPLFNSKRDIELSAVNYKFCESFFSFLTTSKKCHVNGANKQMQRLRKIINYAIRLGYMASNPMSNYQLEFTPVTKLALTMEEVHRIFALQLSQSLEQVKDTFLLQCYTGLSYSDVKALTREHISAGSDKSVWIRMTRQKTKVMFTVPLLPRAQHIISKYLPNSKAGLPLISVLSNQKMNKALKTIQKLAGISKNLTTHLARHTFATTITLSNGVPIETVSKMLGHTKLSTTQVYAKVLENKIGADMQALSSKLRTLGG